MDIELLRTFVEVCRCRHFGKAADLLYITQSAVSARIRQLETSLGCQLLVRERKQVQPTADGERFLRHAESLLKQWERARRDMVESAAGGPPLRIGAIPSLWVSHGIDWLTTYRKQADASRVRIESRESEQLMPRLVEGALDLVIQFDPPRTVGIEHRKLGEMHLVLAATRHGLTIDAALQKSYVELEWGSLFGAAQAEFMEGIVADVRMSSLHDALYWLQQNSGSAYLPENIAQREPGLHIVNDAPRFTREIHAAWLERNERRTVVEAFLGKTHKP